MDTMGRMQCEGYETIRAHRQQLLLSSMLLGSTDGSVDAVVLDAVSSAGLTDNNVEDRGGVADFSTKFVNNCAIRFSSSFVLRLSA